MLLLWELFFMSWNDLVMDVYSFAVHTLGCKVNQYETEAIVSDLLKRGLKLVDFSEQADVYIVNTCTVTGTSDHKSRQWISKAVRKNPDAFIIATGCYAERAKQEIEDISGVDLVIGNSGKEKIGELVSGQPHIDQAPRSSHPNGQHFHTRALVKIEDGCDNFCSYCIVPYVRGKPKSRAVNDIIKEVSGLVKCGAREIVLTGVNLGKYGRDLGSNVNLTELLKHLKEVPELARIRLSSIEINDITPDMITLLSSSPIFCRHLHMPLQSGDDQILKSMNRHYTAEDYLHIVKEVMAAIPGIAVTTDVMVGFPGETEEQFEKTRWMMEEVRYRKVHVFKYSDREGTKASELSEKISPELKEQRSKKLLDLGRQLSENYVQAFIRKKLEVLAEKTLANKLLTGLSDNYIRVSFEGEEKLKGQLVEVMVERIDQLNLYGRIV